MATLESRRNTSTGRTASALLSLALQILPALLLVAVAGIGYLLAGVTGLAAGLLASIALMSRPVWLLLLRPFRRYRFTDSLLTACDVCIYPFTGSSEDSQSSLLREQRLTDIASGR
jgi:hypothetical protein